MTNRNTHFWPGWETVRLIGRGSFGAVYEIQRDVFGDLEKAALKVISIPQNASDIEEMYSDGYDEESITSTFQSHLKSIVAEYSLMRKMNGSSNIVNCDDVLYVQHDDGIGWDIFIKMELLTPLTRALSNEVSEETVVQIAKDMCIALELCKRHEIVHRDIKPQNIFVSANGDYKLGDFGIAKTVEKTMGGTKIGTYKYMAPEVYNNQPYGSSADLYSLGLVLYWLLNERRMPFMPLPPAKLGAGMDDEARHRRLSGEKLPAPAHGSDKLKAIILKACAYSPSERYSSAMAMLDDLCILSGSSEGVSIKENVVVPQTEIEEEPKTTGPVFPKRMKNTADEDLTETTVGPQFFRKEDPNVAIDEEPPVFNDNPKAQRMPYCKKLSRSVLLSLAALWLLSVVLSIFVLSDIPRFVPHIHSAVVPWVYISLFTGWIIPLIATLGMRSIKVEKIIKVAVFIEIFFAVCNLLLAFRAIPFPELYRVIPGAIYLEETFWMIGSHLNEWMPFKVGLLTLLSLVAKDVFALSVNLKTVSNTSCDIEVDADEESPLEGNINEGNSNPSKVTVKNLLVLFITILVLIGVLFMRSGIIGDTTAKTEQNGSNNNNQVVVFKSSETENKLRALLGIPETQNIYLDDISHIERICFVNDAIIVNVWNEFGSAEGYGYWDNQGNKYLVKHDGNRQYTNKVRIDLQDMDLFPNLKEIVVNNAEIDNLSALSKCSDLEVLVLNYCNAVDLNEISRWENVTNLTIGGCNEITADSLSNINNIRILGIYGTYFSDFEQLVNLSKLTDLSLGLGVTVGGTSNSITVETLDPDLSFLESMPNLTSLSLTDGGDISDLSPLSKLTNLRKLELTYFTAVMDISAIGKLKDLEELRFVQMGRVDYSVISELTKLRVLDLTLCRFDDISFVSSLTNLTNLELPQTGVSNISPIVGLTQLTELDIRDANIDDLTLIKDLPLTCIVVSVNLREQAKELFPNATVMG